MRKTVKKFMELASPEELAEAAANDFKKDTSAMVFEACCKIVLQDFKPKNEFDLIINGIGKKL